MSNNENVIFFVLLYKMDQQSVPRFDIKNGIKKHPVINKKSNDDSLNDNTKVKSTSRLDIKNGTKKYHESGFSV
jgi:hypothetical protein